MTPPRSRRPTHARLHTLRRLHSLTARLNPGSSTNRRSRILGNARVGLTNHLAPIAYLPSRPRTRPTQGFRRCPFLPTLIRLPIPTRSIRAILRTSIHPLAVLLRHPLITPIISLDRPTTRFSSLSGPAPTDNDFTPLNTSLNLIDIAAPLPLLTLCSRAGLRDLRTRSIPPHTPRTALTVTSPPRLGTIVTYLIRTVAALRFRNSPHNSHTLRRKLPLTLHPPNRCNHSLPRRSIHAHSRLRLITPTLHANLAVINRPLAIHNPLTSSHPTVGITTNNPLLPTATILPLRRLLSIYLIPQRLPGLRSIHPTLRHRILSITRVRSLTPILPINLLFRHIRSPRIDQTCLLCASPLGILSPLRNLRPFGLT